MGENQLALKTWVKLSRAYSVFAQLTNENIRSFGLTTPQFGVIEVLGHLGPMRIGRLCKKMLVSGGNMTLVLDNLERNNFIKREYSENDRRAIKIALTEKGIGLFNNTIYKHADFITEKMNVLSEEEQNELGKLLKKLGTALE